METGVANTSLLAVLMVLVIFVMISWDSSANNARDRAGLHQTLNPKPGVGFRVLEEWSYILDPAPSSMGVSQNEGYRGPYNKE